MKNLIKEICLNPHTFITTGSFGAKLLFNIDLLQTIGLFLILQAILSLIYIFYIAFKL